MTLRETQEVRDLKFIIDEVADFHLGGLDYTNFDFSTDEVIKLPRGFANYLLEEIEDREPNYFHGWEEGTGPIRFYAGDVVRRLREISDYE